MQEKWYVSAKKADFNEWAGRYGIFPVTARILRNRDILNEEEISRFLYGTRKDFYSPWLLDGMKEAVELIGEELRKGTAIRVVGDYDVDGICASYILTRGLKALGAKVDTAIPHRIHDGYGLNEHLVEQALKDGIGLMITCDNGIAAKEQIQMAVDGGMRVIVTDHHEVPFQQDGEVRRQILPPAQVVIDPKKEQCRYPFKNICGGAVAYKLILALQERQKERTGELSREQEKVAEELLGFAAFATVCDVMELKDENRILVKEGLKVLQKTENPGIRALMEVNQIPVERLSVYHLGFVLGPCLNATGRLDSALRALELLESREKSQAMEAAVWLKELNESRKNLTKQGAEEAAELIEKEGKEDKVLVVYLPEVHESLAGIIAGRIREAYNRPVFVLTKGEEGIKGSGRSIETYSMYEHMAAIPHCFAKFGGHKLAAGLTLARRFATVEEDIAAFRRELNEQCGLTEEDLVPKIHIDVPMPLSYADEKMAKELEKLEPYGVGNPRPLFAEKRVEFLRGFLMGAKKNFARFQVQTSDGMRKELVFFGNLEKFNAYLEEHFGAGTAERLYNGQAYRYSVGASSVQTDKPILLNVTYQLSLNTYKGKESPQCLMQNYMAVHI